MACRAVDIFVVAAVVDFAKFEPKVGWNRPIPSKRDASFLLLLSFSSLATLTITAMSFLNVCCVG